MEEELEKIKRQQFQNYKNAICEIIHNNTNSLVDDDIISLVSKPPLDSMDTIKNKYLAVAKVYDIVVDSVKIEEVIDKFREKIQKDLLQIKNLRTRPLESDVNKFHPVKDLDTFKITKKRLTVINRKINADIKKKLADDVLTLLVGKTNQVYLDFKQCEFQDKIIDDISKYLKKVYQKELMENINMKILVKDTTLISGVKEQGERYKFTQTNSRINKLDVS